MRKAIATAVLAAAVSSAGCAKERHESGGPGPTVSRNYQVGAFDKIEVAGPYDVEVRTGSNPSVQARGGEKAIERMVVEIKDGELRIHPEKQRGMRWSWRDHGKVTLTVTVPALTEATIAGSGGIRVDRVRGDRFEGSIAGSGNLSLDAVEVKALEFSVAGSGEVRAGGGRADTVDLNIAGSGDIDTRAIASRTAKVSIAGSGNVRAQATGTADVGIMGSGDVELTGGARCNVSKAGSGNVRCS